MKCSYTGVCLFQARCTRYGMYVLELVQFLVNSVYLQQCYLFTFWKIFHVKLHPFAGGDRLLVYFG